MKFYNTKNKKQQELEPLSGNIVSMYVCGPTVYASPHLGNARSAIIYDLLYRVLRAKYEVNYVRNITDVDDKINAAAKENGESISDLTERVTQDFHRIMAALGCLPPTHEPRVTENIPEIIEVISSLIKNGHAYEAEGHVLFDVGSYKDYGCLARRSVDEMQAGARVEIAPYKKNAADFVLWKPASEGDDESAKFASPWGIGRPGWHIECTAMSTKFLGETYDIHGGGLDLVFPHHENEVAQGVCAHEDSEYARMWIHNGFLTVDGEKMSKSLGNFTTVSELLDKGVNGDIIRYAFLTAHYRQPLDWNEKLLYDAKNTMDKFYRLPEIEDAAAKADDELSSYLEDDLNTSKAFAYINQQISDYNKSNDAELLTKLLGNIKFMGFLNYSVDEYFGRADDDAEIDELIAARKKAKQDKDFAEADNIRKKLDALGIIIEDNRDGSTEWRRK
ncbi:MAG: cysteine--tRNA ligase [Alphaproteobacteria bacterium CG11_big_fil_rev_8_21_14_0_20_44_7]|nr:MAG: cysteine--tRNA ligase [Alphaproteobacteria bacterium CG11_big_fil_rev_8_21_14_0_20_44_7]